MAVIPNNRIPLNDTTPARIQMNTAHTTRKETRQRRLFDQQWSDNKGYIRWIYHVEKKEPINGTQTREESQHSWSTFKILRLISNANNPTF